MSPLILDYARRPFAHDSPRRLVQDGVLGPEGENGRLVFTEDHAFNSPSGAAVIVQGMHINGWKARVDKKGRTLDELERR